MTIEEDTVVIIQGLFILAAPIFIHRTVLLWQGILAGGVAKTQAWIAFSTDPLTVLSATACAGAMVFFWTFVLMCRWLERSHLHGSDTD